MEWLLDLLPAWYVLVIGAFSVWLAIIFFFLPLTVFCLKPLRARDPAKHGRLCRACIARNGRAQR